MVKNGKRIGNIVAAEKQIEGFYSAHSLPPRTRPLHVIDAVDDVRKLQNLRKYRRLGR